MSQGRLRAARSYWHYDFGHARSQRCVNRAPIDARYVFVCAARACPSLGTSLFGTGGCEVDSGSILRRFGFPFVLLPRAHGLGFFPSVPLLSPRGFAF